VGVPEHFDNSHRPCLVILDDLLNDVVALKNVRDKKEFQDLAQHVYPEYSGSLYDAYLDATSRPHAYLFLDLTQDTNNDLRFRNAIFPSVQPLVVYSDIGDEACEIALSCPPSVEDG
jgi:hypothetical protein